MNLLILLIGVILGYLIVVFFSGKKKGEQGRLKSLKFKIGDYVIHLHHWFIASIGLMTLLFFNLYNNFIYGLLIGVIIQGLIYKDFYKLIYKKR